MPFLCSTVSNFHDNQTSERKTRARETRWTRDDIENSEKFSRSRRVSVSVSLYRVRKEERKLVLRARLAFACMPKRRKKIAPVLQETIFFFTNKEP